VKILLLAPHPYYVDRGTPIDVDILLRALSAGGHHVDLVCYAEGEPRDYPGISIHRVGARGRAGIGRPGFSFRKLRNDVGLARRAWALAAANDYDVVHAGEEAVFIAMALKRRFGIPYVYDMDSSIAQQMVEQMGALRLLGPLLDGCEAAAIRGAAAVAPVCNKLAELAHERGAALVETLHDISQLEECSESSGKIREKLGIEGILMMYVGNLEPYQGVDLLLDALALAAPQVEQVDLVIAGGSSEHIEAYTKRAESLGVAERVHFLGPWPARKLGELLAEADILTAPRIRGINTPMKIFPYLHSGRPVLATALPTHTQILSDSLCVLAPADPPGFAQGMVALASDASLRARIGASGKAFVEENHTFAAHRRRVDRLYAELAVRIEAQRSSYAD